MLGMATLQASGASTHPPPPLPSPPSPLTPSHIPSYLPSYYTYPSPSSFLLIASSPPPHPPTYLLHRPLLPLLLLPFFPLHPSPTFSSLSYTSFSSSLSLCTHRLSYGHYQHRPRISRSACGNHSGVKHSL